MAYDVAMDTDGKSKCFFEMNSAHEWYYKLDLISLCVLHHEYDT
jgi:hypothetical protein